MDHTHHFYIGGTWVRPSGSRSLAVVNPATEEAFASIALGEAADVDKAVAAARAAFPAFAATSRDARVALLQRILACFDTRAADLAQAVSSEMGAPLGFALEEQVASGRAHIETAIDVLRDFSFERDLGTTRVLREAIGVVGLITPWNWPLNQIAAKVAPALAAGCTMVLKPSELSPLNAIIFAEVLDAAGVPPGVFNLVNGDGPGVGHAISAHPGIDMVSFTGSTRAGIMVAKTAADTVKRVTQELGGKSANILFPDVDFSDAVKKGANKCFSNAGQSCNAPTRMMVPRNRMDEALAIATAAAAKYEAHMGSAADSWVGPVVSQAQFSKIQGLIESGIAEGARLAAGGPGRPAGLNRGYFVRPTVFGNVTPAMRIAREEIFGPVLSVMAYDTVDDAIAMANATEFGLAAYIQSADLQAAREAAKRMRVGCVYINYPAWDTHMPFGGYKQSGNGREYGVFGLEDYLEVKGIAGYSAA